MKLVWLEVCGYKRFASRSKINLSEKLVAIVGPNEAGKTSLLKCLEHLNGQQPFVADGGSQELTRGAEIDAEHPIAVWTFAIEERDRAELASIPEALATRWYELTKKASGNYTFRLIPAPKRDLTPRVAALDELTEWIEGARNDKDSIDLVAEAIDLKKALMTRVETLAKAALEAIQRFEKRLSGPHHGHLNTVLLSLHQVESSETPQKRFGDILFKRLPKVLFFSDADRDLRSAYDLRKYCLKEVDGARREPIPTALNNLALASGVNIHDLYAAQEKQDRGRVRTILAKAEERLTRLLRESWSQSQLSVSLELDGNSFQILMQSELGEYVRVIERSDGLRQFFALLLFMSKQSSSAERPILLIDEVENRLHYDAQADLVQVLARQQLASKIVYTTHSIGCLPEDLGSGVRMVALDPPYSCVVNHFWDSKRPGFSPLLFSMGAQTLAFLPMRFALIAEGAADMILLPAILKEAMQVESLGFQVVPGLSSGTTQEIAILDNESARTAYLTDSDAAGKRLKSKILAAGVRENMIVTLPEIDGSETVLEDYIPIESYIAAVTVELSRSGCSEEITPDDLTRPNRPSKLAAWCKARNVQVPSKRAVAYHLVEKKYELPIVDLSVVEHVVSLYKTVATALGLETR